MLDVPRTTELIPVDTTDGQVDEAEELEEFLSSLNISGKDRASRVSVDGATEHGTAMSYRRTSSPTS